MAKFRPTHTPRPFFSKTNGFLPGKASTKNEVDQFNIFLDILLTGAQTDTQSKKPCHAKHGLGLIRCPFAMYILFFLLKNRWTYIVVTSRIHLISLRCKFNAVPCNVLTYFVSRATIHTPIPENGHSNVQMTDCMVTSAILPWFCTKNCIFLVFHTSQSKPLILDLYSFILQQDLCIVILCQTSRVTRGWSLL